MKSVNKRHTFQENRFIPVDDSTSNSHVDYNGSGIKSGSSGRYVLFVAPYDNRNAGIFFINAENGSIYEIAEQKATQFKISVFFSESTGFLCVKMSDSTSIRYSILKL